MRVQRSLILAAAVMPLVSAAAFAQTFAISLGVRETGTTAAIGADGGAANSIEIVRIDGQSLVADGTWQQFAFHFKSDPVSYFAGTQPTGGAANQLDGTKGVIEMLRVRNSSGVTDPIALFVDDVVNTAGGVDTTIADFDSYAAVATPTNGAPEVMFRDPRFSGSTNANLVTNDTGNVTAESAHSGANSYRLGFQWNNGATSNWVRLTTNNTASIPNPTIDFTDGNTVSLWLRAVVLEPAVRWIATGDGNWNDAANWNNGTVANAISGTSATANFTGAATGPAKVTIDAPVSTNLLRFKNTNSYTIDGTDTNTLTVSGAAGFAGNINAELGSHTVSAPIIQLDRGMIINANAGASLLITRPIIQNLTGGTTEVNTLSLTKQGGGTLSMQKLNVATLIVNDAGVLNIAPGNAASRISFLSMTTSSGIPTATVNISNNTVVYDLDEAAATLSTQLATTIGRVKNAYASGAWTGTGVTSSNAAAAAATANKTGIAVVLASDLGVAGGTFENVAIAGDGIILKYALVGDINLDTKVNTVDFNILAGNFGGATDIRWSKGDFDYDADVDSTDFNAFAANYGKTLPTAAPALGAVVPEPVSMGLLMIPAFAAMRRRRS